MKHLVVLIAAALASPPGWTDHPLETYYRIRSTLPGDRQPDVASLLEAADRQCIDSPDDPDAWLAAGILRAAMAKGDGLKGLSTLRQAKRDLERSIALDSDWLGGYARAFLGRLHLTVPSWPIAFGNDRRGAASLEGVLEDDGRSLAGNLYEGLRLKGEGINAGAERHLRVATTATLPCECPYWQQYLRSQASSELGAD